jgi:hypothetical protein
MILRLVLSACIISLISVSCENNKDNAEDINFKESGLVIKMSNACGFCGGADSLIITETKIRYEFIDPCGDNDCDHSSATDQEDWDELNDLLNLKKFEDITLNTCYVCVDGCDTWISVKTESFYHEIRYADFDSIAVKGIRPFIEKLEDIRLNRIDN